MSVLILLFCACRILVGVPNGTVTNANVANTGYILQCNLASSGNCIPLNGAGSGNDRFLYDITSMYLQMFYVY